MMFKGFVKHVIFPLHERFFGRKTFSCLRELERLQWASVQELEELRFRKLRDLLLHAESNIPFYKKRFDRAGFNPARMNSVEDIKVLPVLRKAEIRENLQDMTWKNCPGGLFRYNTGGSSGEPLIFYYDRRRQAYDAAARALSHRWWGIDVGDRELYLWGSPVEINKQDRMKDLRDRLTNQCLLSAFEISSENIPQYVDRFKKFKPRCVFGYPSTIALFCQMAGKQGYVLNDCGIGVVFSTAEVLYKTQRQLIKNFFGGVPVADGYGSREAGFISHQCPEGAYHVIDPNYVIEYLRDEQEVADGEDGEIVVTHLDAWGMPFIRYGTGDIAKPSGGSCMCGRGFSTMRHIQGRTTDFIVTADGRWQHGLSVIYVVRDIEGVKEFRIIQEDLNELRVLLKIHEDIYPPDGNDHIVKGLKKRMGKDVKVSVELVDEIPRDASGKYRYVVSRVAEKGFI